MRAYFAGDFTFREPGGSEPWKKSASGQGKETGGPPRGLDPKI